MLSLTVTEHTYRVVEIAQHDQNWVRICEIVFAKGEPDPIKTSGKITVERIDRAREFIAATVG